MDASKESTVWIERLPPELLQIIFNFVHEDFKLTTASFERGLSHPEIDIFGDPDHDDRNYQMEVAQFLGEQNKQLISSRSPSLFPYNLAAVCDTWKNVLSASPAFWTHLVFFIDSSTPIEDAREYLEWSRQLPIDVFLLRKYKNRENLTIDYRFEPPRVHAFIGLLQAHMKRCRSLHIDVTANMSLPSLSDIVLNDAPSLKSLHVNCEFDFVPSRKEEIVAEMHPSSPVPPRLHTMNLDAQSFLRACIRPPCWFIHQPQLRHLGISNGNASVLSLDTALETINMHLNFTLLSLSFSSIKFTIDTKHIEADEYSFERVQQLVLENICFEAVSELFRVCSFPCLNFLHIQNCSGLDKGIFNNAATDIRMIAISYPKATHFEISEFLSGWSGVGLYLSASDSPYNHLVEALATPPEVTLPTDPTTLCPHLQILVFVGCPVPSFASIKTMIERRNCDVNYDDPDWKTNTSFGPAIRTLEIMNCFSTLESPKWTQEEKDWVSKKVADFTWTDLTLLSSVR